MPAVMAQASKKTKDVQPSLAYSRFQATLNYTSPPATKIFNALFRFSTLGESPLGN